MSKELVIGSNRHETKVAILEDDQLAEIYFQRGNEYSLAGSIHKGRVTRVLPGMQSAFVDLGLERDTFLYVSDFFEENEDIDTVAEEKPGRGDRRERGQQRPIERLPIVVVQEVEPVVPVLAPAAEAPEPPIAAEETVPSAEVAARPEAAEPRTERPADGDRGFRGDRRGRRSRRRRSRGRGFPENKYAQPGSAPAPDREPAPSTVGSATEEADEQGDVIILPGESLAKYRRLSTAGESEAREPENTDSGDESVDLNPDLESEVIQDEELEAEAQELELVDKVLSHHEDDSVLEEEEKIEEVRNEQPDSPFIVSDIVAEDEEEDETEPRGGQQASPFVSAETIPPFHPDVFIAPVPYAYEEQTPIEAEIRLTVRESVERFETEPRAVEFPGEVPSTEEPSGAELASEEETFGGELLEPSDFEGADIEDARALAPSDAEAGTEGAPEPHGAGGVQTATVRDQGDRYMHRVSRRMRRRRGGNRFSQQSGEVGLPSGSSAGAAAALVQTQQPDVRREVNEERSSERPERVMPSIAELLKPGQEIIVQIAKEPLGQKGARITSHIALPGRYVVFMPSVTHLGVSRKIESDEERQRLKRVLQAHRVGTTGGFIVRTAGEGIPEDEIAADMDFLYKLWLDIRQKAEKRPAPALLHYDLDIVQRILRDQVTDEFKAIWVDNEEMYENVLSFTQRFQPALVGRVKMYTRSAPIFDAFGITQELEKALRPKVWLKSGGYIVINQTEALVAIDINTGKYVGKSNRLEDTIVKTNIEAVKEIVRQIRLRDLGGIIVVDFIDMDERKNRQKVMQALEEAMHSDRAPYKILQFNDFGLVAITRKRVKQSLERTLCSPCPYCEGAGYVKSVQTIISEILVEAQKIARALEGKDVLLRVHPDVAKVLKANDNHYLEELEGILRRPVLVKGDPLLHHEKFDLG